MILKVCCQVFFFFHIPMISSEVATLISSEVSVYENNGYISLQWTVVEKYQRSPVLGGASTMYAFFMQNFKECFISKLVCRGPFKHTVFLAFEILTLFEGKR